MRIIHLVAALKERKIPTRTGEMLMTTDDHTGARYLYLEPSSRGQAGVAVRTEEISTGKVLFDFDSAGKLIGIEIV